MITRILGLPLIAAVLALSLFGCQETTSPQPSPAPSPAAAPAEVQEHPKHALNVNFTNDVGAVVVETPTCEWTKSAADGAAGTATAETVMGVVGPGPAGIAVGAVQFAPAAALTADATNNATITIAKRTNATPGTPVTIATGVTAASGANSTGNWTQWKTVPFTVVSGAAVSPGDVLTITIAKGGTGVVVPAGEIGVFTTLN